MAKFEEVGLVESIAARNALYLKRNIPLTDLQRQYQTREAELNNLIKTGNRSGSKTLLVMDESSMTGIADTVQIGALAKTLGARVVFQGDIKQHGSVPAGRAFDQAQGLGMNTSALKETRRFDNAAPEVKAALKDLEHGRYKEALGRITTIEVSDAGVAQTAAEQYVTNYRLLQEKGIRAPLIGVITLTNQDRQNVNAAVSSLLAQNGIISEDAVTKNHLDSPKLTQAERSLAGELRAAKVDRLFFQQAYPDVGVHASDVLQVKDYDVAQNRVIAVNAAGATVRINPQSHENFVPMCAQARDFRQGDLVEARAKIHFEDKSQATVSNGKRGTIEKIEQSKTVVRWESGERSELNNKLMAFVDHAYAHTSHKEQGASNDMEIGAFGSTGTKVFNRVATLLTLTRSKGDVVIVTADKATMLKNAGVELNKTTAVDWKKDQALSDLAHVYSDNRNVHHKVQQPTREKELVPTQDRGS
ncbi:MAG: AAA family ATPase, partial [Betaproteobacteria bacterium]